MNQYQACTALTFALLLLLITSLYSNVFNYQLTVSLDIYPKNLTSRKLILGWSTFVGRPYSSRNWMRYCPDFSCDISSKRGDMQIADAIVFNMGEAREDDIPTLRLPHQRYILHNVESYIVGYTPNLPNFFNWTMSYRSDSDIYSPYGLIAKQPNSQFDHNQLVKTVENKKFVAIVIASNCNSQSNRESVVEEMSKYLDIHKYGSCGDRKCTRSDHHKTQNYSCVDDMGGKYKFYLAFENSLCREYVTEKLFLRLLDPIVPVVLKKENYEKLMPPKSFIAVDQFRSVEEMSLYLDKLDKNNSAYMEYLEWRKDYVVLPYDYIESSPSHGFCALCKALHNGTLPHKSIPNVKDWWSANKFCES